MADQTDWIALRENWRPRWLGSIQEFADLNTQRLRWLDAAEPSPHWSFVEYMCCYFDDLELGDDDLGYQGWVDHGLATQAEVEAVNRFHVLASKYNSPNGDYDNQAVLVDPKWLAVVQAAQEAQRLLAAMLSSPEELRLLLEP